MLLYLSFTQHQKLHSTSMSFQRQIHTKSHFRMLWKRKWIDIRISLFLFDILHLENTLNESCIEIIKIQDANFFQHDLNKVDVRLAYHAVLLSTPPPLLQPCRTHILTVLTIKSVVCVSSDGEWYTLICFPSTTDHSTAHHRPMIHTTS